METGLDYFNARYYGSIQGRFISPDPLLSSDIPAEPQSWNRYSYCLNKPLRYVDPNGLIWQKKTTVKDNVSTTEYKWVWQNDPEKDWDRVTDFWVDVVGPDGATVGLHLNPNGPKSFLQKLLELDSGWGLLSYQDDYHVNGYEYTASSEDRRRSSGIDMLSNQAFDVGLSLAGIRGIGVLGKGAPQFADGLIGVPRNALERASARLYGMKVGDKPLVNSIEAFGSRAGSTFRGRGPSATSDLDLFVDMHPSLRWGRSAGWVDRTLQLIQSDFAREAGFKLDIRTGTQGVEGTPFVPIKKPVSKQ